MLHSNNYKYDFFKVQASACDLCAQTMASYTGQRCSDLNQFQVLCLALPSWHNAGSLPQGQVACNNISREEANVGELLRGCEAQLRLGVGVVCLRKYVRLFSVWFLQGLNFSSVSYSDYFSNMVTHRKTRDVRVFLCWLQGGRCIDTEVCEHKNIWTYLLEPHSALIQKLDLDLIYIYKVKNMVENLQLGSLSFQGKVRSKARICLRFFHVLFFLPAAAPPIPECCKDQKMRKRRNRPS